MREPAWYYFGQWPLVVFPWPILVILGFVASKQKTLEALKFPKSWRLRKLRTKTSLNVFYGAGAHADLLFLDAPG